LPKIFFFNIFKTNIKIRASSIISSDPGTKQKNSSRRLIKQRENLFPYKCLIFSFKLNFNISKLKDKQATLKDLIYKQTRGLNKEQILGLANMDFIRNYQNIIITGKTGTGKSYLAQSLANRAIMDGFKAYYIRVPTILEDISISRADGTYTNFLRKLSKYNLLILDDFGINALSADDATNLLEIIESRVDLSSIIITSQLPVAQWYDYLNNDTVADAILDRIVHSSHRVEIKGVSMRKIMSKID